MGKGKKSKKHFKKLKVLLCPASVMASAEIRLFYPFGWLAREGLIEAGVFPESHITLLAVDEADVIIFQRNTDSKVIRIAEYAKQMGKTVIYDIDDNFLTIPKDTPEIGEYYNKPSVKEAFKKMLNSADAVTTSTEYLANIFKEFNPNIRVVPNCVDFELAPIRPQTEDQIVIGYAGGQSHASDFEVVTPALKKILRESNAKVRMEFFGFVPPELATLDSVSFLPLTKNYQEYIGRLNEVRWSFAISPLDDTPHNMSKSEIKIIEYASRKIPAIYSDIPVYSHHVKNRITGLLVPHTTTGWLQGINEMIEHPELRRQIANNAFWYAKDNYTAKRAALSWLAVLRSPKGSSQKPEVVPVELEAISHDKRRTKPLMSVIMPTFRRVKSGLLDRAIRSVLNQTFKDFEFIIVDDGSTDGTKEILSRYAEKDLRIKVQRYEKNSGLPGLRVNQALTSVKGELIAYMFDDDVWLPHALEVLYQSLQEHPDWDLTYGDVSFPYWDTYGNPIVGSWGTQTEEFNYTRLAQSNYISNNAVMHHKYCLDEVGLYDPHILIRRLCDWDLWLRMAKRFKMEHTPVFIGEIRGPVTDDSLGTTVTLDLEITRKYMALDRNKYLTFKNFNDYKVDNLEIFEGGLTNDEKRRIFEIFAEFYEQIKNFERAQFYRENAMSIQDKFPNQS